MLSKTRRTLAVASIVGALGLGLAATAPAAVAADAQDRGARMITGAERHEGLQSWLEAFLDRLLAVWAADGSNENPNGTPAH